MESKVAWWDKLGKPQYGGEMVIRASRDIVNFDPYASAQLAGVHTAWMERLLADDWTLDPAVFDYRISFRPYQHLRGQLAESWEFPDPSTFLVHLRKGVHWQDIPPVNGREFIADDVVYHYHRLYGLGSGMTPSPSSSGFAAFKHLLAVTAVDKYTVVFKWNVPSPELIMENMQPPGPTHVFEAREAVEKWGDLSDWRHAIGTGPFLLQDLVPGISATLVKNPSYWGYDERYPQNQLPYVDTVKYLIIPDTAAAVAAMRQGKIDIIHPISPVQALAVRKTNPEIVQIPIPFPPTISLEPRNDRAPFNDIRVRKAMQMAIDLPGIAESYYGGAVEPYPSTLTSRYMKGWGFPYEEWPQDLKDEYAYNPTAAKKLLADAGYPDGFKTNIVADTAGDIDLLKVVKSYFARVGIDMEIRPMYTAAWVNFVDAHKHDQMVHLSAGPLGHTSAPLMNLTRFQTGSSINYGMINDPVYDTLYAKAMAATSLDGVLRILRDANERIARQHYAISLLQPVSYSLCQPWLKGFNGQHGSVWSATSPGMLSFYLGRFWIDQKMKKSMRH